MVSDKALLDGMAWSEEYSLGFQVDWDSIVKVDGATPERWLCKGPW